MQKFITGRGSVQRGSLGWSSKMQHIFKGGGGADVSRCNVLFRGGWGVDVLWWWRCNIVFTGGARATVSACPVASRLLGLSGGFSASRLARRLRWLLGFSACPVASRLRGFSACVGLLGFSASGRISGPLLPVLWDIYIRIFTAFLQLGLLGRLRQCTWQCITCQQRNRKRLQETAPAGHRASADSS